MLRQAVWCDFSKPIWRGHYHTLRFPAYAKRDSRCCEICAAPYQKSVNGMVSPTAQGQADKAGLPRSEWPEYGRVQAAAVRRDR